MDIKATAKSWMTHLFDIIELLYWEWRTGQHLKGRPEEGTYHDYKGE